MSQTAIEDRQETRQETRRWHNSGFAYGIEWLVIASTEAWWTHVWFPAGFDHQLGSTGHVIQFRDEPEALYVTERSTSRDAVIAGPLPTLEAAQLAYLLHLGDK